MKYTNKLNLPQPIVDAVQRDDYDRGDSDYTVTELLSPPKANVLIKEHWDEIEEDVADNIYALMGKAIHTILEKSDRVALTEDRYYIQVAGKRISGKYDRMVIGNEQWWGKYMKFLRSMVKNPDLTMQDYKIASVWEYIYGIKPDRVAQLNILAYIARKNGYNVVQNQVVFIFRDWMKSKTKYDSNYPQKQVAVIDVPMWSNEETEKYITERITLHEDAKNNLPECSFEEIWGNKEKWAVYKNDNKTATRVCDTEEDANNYIIWADGEILKKEQETGKKQKAVNWRIEHRKKPPNRCRDYCSGFNFCKQGQDYYKDIDDGGQNE